VIILLLLSLPLSIEPHGFFGGRFALGTTQVSNGKGGEAANFVAEWTAS